MTEVWGVFVVSSVLGGTSIGTTRSWSTPPNRWRSARSGSGWTSCCFAGGAGAATSLAAADDWPLVAGLGLLFYAPIPILFKASLTFTTAARGSLALLTLPMLTMVVGTALGSEPLTARRTAGVLVAISGDSMALLSGLTTAPDGARSAATF